MAGPNILGAGQGFSSEAIMNFLSSSTALIYFVGIIGIILWLFFEGYRKEKVFKSWPSHALVIDKRHANKIYSSSLRTFMKESAGEKIYSAELKEFPAVICEPPPTAITWPNKKNSTAIGLKLSHDSIAWADVIETQEGAYLVTQNITTIVLPQVRRLCNLHTKSSLDKSFWQKLTNNPTNILLLLMVCFILVLAVTVFLAPKPDARLQIMNQLTNTIAQVAQKTGKVC